MVKRVEDIWAAHISVSPAVVGGKPHITGHRITVQSVAVWHKRLGMSVEDIVSSFGLRLVEVRAALGYYLAHRADIEAAIQADEAFVAAIRSRIPSKLR